MLAVLLAEPPGQQQHGGAQLLGQRLGIGDAYTEGRSARQWMARDDAGLGSRSQALKRTGVHRRTGGVRGRISRGGAPTDAREGLTQGR